jgi:hypothetical protein
LPPSTMSTTTSTQRNSPLAATTRLKRTQSSSLPSLFPELHIHSQQHLEFEIHTNCVILIDSLSLCVCVCSCII